MKPDAAIQLRMRRDLRLFSAVLLMCVLVGLGFLMSGGGGLHVTAIWDFGATAGMFGFLALLCVFTISARPAGWPACGGKFYMVLHRWLGTGALIATVLHVIAMFCATPAMLRYIEVGAPWYMLAGVAAAIVLALTSIGAFPSPRKAVFRTVGMFRRWHFGAGVVTLALTTWHVLGTGFHVGTTARMAVCALAVLLACVRAIVTMVRVGRPVASGPGRRIHAVGTARSLAGGMFLLVMLAGLTFALLPHGGVG